VSTAAVVERPREVEELDWVVLHEPTFTPSSHQRVEIVGRGIDRRGQVGRGRARRSPRTLVALPSVDELTS
jgi:hypothetical protein